MREVPRKSLILRTDLFFEEGTGGPADVKRAFDLYEKSASAGNSFAMRRLGSLFERGVLPYFIAHRSPSISVTSRDDDSAATVTRKKTR